MAATVFADLNFEPQVFADYVTQLTVEKSALVQSGIMSRDPQIQAAANGGGGMVSLPYFDDLDGDAEVLSDSASLTVNPITGDTDIAVKLMRGKAFGGNDLVTVLAGTDPMAAVANRVADYWVRQEQKALIASLTGVFATALASTHVLNITAEVTDNFLNADAILDGKQLLGDAGGSIAAICMHSAKFTALQKQNLIAAVRDSEGNVQFNTYLGYRIIVDDSLIPATGNYTTYLFAAGAVAGADVAVPNPLEFDRNSLASQDLMITRKGWVAHVRGVKYGLSTVNPANTVLDDGATWTKVYDSKAIRVVKLLTK